MIRVNSVRGIAVCAMLLFATTAFGAAYTSTGSGLWNDVNTWGGGGFPVSGDTATITGSHTVTVTGTQICQNLVIDGTNGNKLLLVDTGATLIVESAIHPAISINAPLPGSSNTIRVDGGLLETSDSGMAIFGGGSGVSKVELVNSGIARLAGDLSFSGTAANAQIEFDLTGGTFEIGGDLGSGGTFINSTVATVKINGTGAQTVNGYTFHNLTISKAGGTATLNGPIQVDGDFAVSSGVFDDGGYQIALNSGGTSSVSVGSVGVLKLGSAATATTFPAPFAGVSLSPGSAVVYQAGVTQTIEDSFTYQRLYLSTLGGNVDKVLAAGALTVDGELNIAKNGINNVTLLLNAGLLDANGDITGDGTVTLTTGSVDIAGNWSNLGTLNAGTSTVTYDGGGAQNVLGTSYHHLDIDKATGAAAFGGNASILGNLGVLSLGTLTANTNTITLFGNATVNSIFDVSSGTIRFNGTSAQTFDNFFSGFNVLNFELDNANGLTVNATGTIVDGSLTLTDGVLTVSGNLFVDVLATVTRTNGWVYGELTMGLNPTPARRFHLGTPTAYLPVDVDAGTAGTVALQAKEGQSPDRTADNVLERYWTLGSASVTSLDFITFNYNQSDVVTGSEAQYILAHYDGGSFTFTHFGGVNSVTNTVTAPTPAVFVGDWIIGQPGSLAAASKLAIVSVNSGTDPQDGFPFDVVVEAQDDDGDATAVFDPTDVALTVFTGTGTLGGTLTGQIASATDTITISGVEYTPAENGVVLEVSRSTGDLLTNGVSAAFNVVSAPTTVTVSSINDSGAGTLRQAIADANSATCGSPCTIEFSTSGTIMLATALPAITASNVTIDGFTAPGATPNTTAFGLPSNANLTVAIDGTSGVTVGLAVQATNFKVQGLAIKNFTAAPGLGISFTGSTTGSAVAGCHIGTSLSGLTAEPNLYGILAGAGASGITIGGTLPAARNLLGGHASGGAAIDMSSSASTILVLGNYVGVRANLTSAIPNSVGVNVVSGATGVTIGTASMGNVVSGNTVNGIAIHTDGVTVRSNLIGPAGSSNSSTIPNGNGIHVGAGVTTGTILDNTISGNSYGISLVGNGITVDQNRIGVAPDGTTAMGNTNAGVLLQSTAAGHRIGTTNGNVIAHNQIGIKTVTATGIGNTFRRNAIHSNSFRAIDLNADGTTFNDATDADTGSNNLQNFPVISSAVYSGGTLSVKTTLNSSAGVSVGGVLFDFYKADGSGQAVTYLGNACGAGNVFTNAVFNIATGSVNVGDTVVGTATAFSDGTCTTVSEGTSELSAATIVNGDVHWIAGNGNWETAANWNPAVVPGAGDNAYLDNTGTYTVTVNSLVSVASVHVGAASGTQTLTVPSGQSLSFDAASSVTANGVLNFTGFNLGGTGTLGVSGILNWFDGTLYGGGGITVNSGGALNINSAAPKNFTNSSLTVAAGATVNWNGGNLSLATGSAIDNFGTFEVMTDASISNGGLGGTFDNDGTFRKTVTVGTTLFTGITLNHNSGTVDIQTGRLNPAGGTAASTITLGSGADFYVDSDTYTFAHGTNVSGLGKVHITGGTLNVTGPNVLVQHLLLDLGTLGGAGTVRSGSTGNWVWSGGTMGGAGQSTLENGSTMSIGTASAKSLVSRTLFIQVGATASWFGTGAIQLSTGGNIQNSGMFDAQNDAMFTDAGAAGGFINSGIFKKTASAGTTGFTNVALTNYGTVQVQTGTLNPSSFLSNGPVQLTGTLLIDDSTATLSTGADVSGTGLLYVNGGTLTADVTDVIPNVQFDLGTINGAGSISVSALTWNSGTMAGTGTTTIPALGTATLAGIGPKDLHRTLTVANGGTMNVTGFGTINLAAGGNIANDGLLEITTNVTFFDAGSGGDINNTRTFRVNLPGGFMALGGITFNNTGGAANADLVSGSLNLADGTSSGQFTLAPLTTLLIDSDTYTFATGTTVTGTGTVDLSVGTLNVTGNVSIPTFSQSGGTLGGSGTLTLTGASTWSGGTMQGGGTTAIANAATLAMSGFSAKALDNRTLSVLTGGTVNLTDGSAINLSNGANVANAGNFNLLGNHTFSNSVLAGDFVNTGTVTKSTSTGPVTFGGVGFTNNGGLVDLQTGTLAVNSDAFTQSSGTLKLWLNGTTPGTGFAQVSTTNPANLAGTLQIALVGPYQPNAGDTFNVISAASHVGDFTQPYSYPALAGGRTFSDAYTAGGLVLTVTGNGDLTIDKSAPSNVTAGAPIAYTLTVNNAGPDAATSVSVSDVLETGHTGISASGAGWTCNVTVLTVTCTAASLPVGTASPITINATAPATPQTFTNVANVSSSNDPTPGNNSDSAIVTVDPQQADLELSAFSPIAPVAPNSNFTFDFQIQNDGPQTASNVVFTAPIPATLTYNSATPDTGSCNFAGGTITCNLGNILNGITVGVLVDLNTTTTAGTHTVTGSATATETDPLPGNNSISPAVEVTGSTLTVVNVNDSGPGSLREALLDSANGVCTLPCAIHFNIAAPPFVIEPLTDLPPVAGQVILDGTTQPGYTSAPIVHIDGQDVLDAALSVSGDDNTVRGLALTAANYGLDIDGNSNTIEANYVGLNPLGNAAPNGVGIEITGDGNVIGGTTAGQRNVISGNNGIGVFLTGTASANAISGNYIGTDPAGTSARANNTGVEIGDEADTNTVGGATAAHGNVISGNASSGVSIEGASYSVIAGGVRTNGAAPGNDGVVGTIVRNNRIGPNAAGTAPLGSTVAGISVVDNAGGTQITGNTVSGHANGITVDESNAVNTTITGNLIGVAPDGVTAMANSQSGVVLDGGNAQLSGNTIAHNGGKGVLVTSGDGNSILSNAMHDNALLGIDLNGDGVTPNDAGDGDSGPNGLQNAPVVSSVSLTGGGNVHVAYSVDSFTTGAGSIRVEFFEADGAGEGESFLGTACVAGNLFSAGATFAAPGLAPGDPVVLTATSYGDAACTTVADGTSEFSNAVNAVTCVPPPVTITGPTAMCAGSGPVVLDAGPGFADYAWSNGATTQQISVTPGGTTTYTVTVTTGAGCTNSDSHTVTVNPLPVVTITGPASVCAGGSVTLDAGPGFSNYAWSTGATTQQISVSPGTTTIYSVTVTDGNSCQGSDTHTVTVTSNPTVTITGPANVCAGTPVTLDAGPGFASYAWSTGATTQQISVTPGTTTTYSVTVGDGTCSATDSHTVTVDPAPTASITPSGPTTFCAGGSVTLTASNGTSWLWNNGATSQSINVTASGTFNVQVFSGSCSASSAPVTVTVNPAPAVTITGPAATCTSAPVTLDAGPGFASYLWNTGATTQQITVTPAATTTYSVTVSDGTCSGSDSHVVNVSSNPVAAITAPAGVCESSNHTASVASQPGATYAWTITNGTINSGQGSSAIVFTAGTTGSVTLGVTVTAGSCTSTGSTVIPISPRPSVVITAPATAASSQTGLVASVPAQPGATYDWSITNGSIDSGDGTNAITFTAGASGVTSLVVSASLGGCTETNSHHVFVDPPPTGDNGADLAITKLAPATVQPGANIIYTIGVRNNGPEAAHGIVITDNFPAGTTFVSVNGGPWNCTALNASIRCTGVAAAGTSSSIALTLTAPQSGTVVNVAEVTSVSPDPVATNNSASVATNVLVTQPTCITTPPALVSPANGATVTSPVTFSWSAVFGATEYELWIDDSLVAVTTSTSLTRPAASGLSEWFVVARLATGCEPLSSATRTFIVPLSTGCPTQAPQITAPANGATVGSNVTVVWTPVAQAAGYRVSIVAGDTATQDAGTVGPTTTSLNVALPYGTVAVYVDAIFAGCEPGRSAPVTLNVPAPDPCAARGTASPIAPANTAVINSSSIDFSWTPVANADGYRVWFSLDGAAPAVLGTTTDETSLRAAIGRGSVSWFVEALFDGCASTESPSVRFTIPARNDCTQARPELLAPARNSTTSNAGVTFAWSAVPNAVSYELWVAVDNGTPALLGTTAGTSLTRNVPPGTIDWSVTAVVDRCGPRESQGSRFTYEPPASCADFDRANVIEPLDGAVLSGPVNFAWYAAAGATRYDVYVIRGGETSMVATTTQTEANGISLAAGRVQWYVRASFGGNCSPLDSELRDLQIVGAPPACSVLTPPAISAPGQISSDVPFLVQWTPVAGATAYQLQIADNPQFGAAQVITTAGTQHQLVRGNNNDAPRAIYLRVRSVDSRCRPVPAVSAYSDRSLLFILPWRGNEGSAPLSGTPVVFDIPLGRELAGQIFSAVAKQPWLTVTPPSGVVGPNGGSLTVTANTAALPVGTSLGGVIVTLGSNAGGVASNATTSFPSNYSVTLVTPVTENPKNTPPPDALIIPAIAHAGGINSQFQSDVRVSNTSPGLITYQMTFTPSGDSGMTDGQQSTFSIEPGQTIALDDILKSWFGTGNGSAMGTLEIRPLTQTATSTSGSALTGLANLVSFASSRTFNLTANGTFGQYIPAIPFANFIGRAGAGQAKKLLSLQQIAQSAKYRTNLGLLEGSGDPVSLLVRVFGTAGEYLTEFPVDLKGGQHLQLNAFLRSQGIESLSDGRVEVEVVSGSGKVTAYASVLDNDTSDPLLVTPVSIDDVGASKWVLPGVADLVSGFANWQTDMRLFNAGTEAVEATLSFYSQSGGEPKVRTLTIGAGHVQQFDRTLASLFGTGSDAGAVHIATAGPAKLIATARTYNQTSTGTYGQFISAVTPAEAAGTDSRPLQLLQVEETDRFRSNVGFAEVTGNPVRIEISVVPPDAKFTAVTELDLAPNEFRQLGSLLRSMGLADTYNARVTVRAIAGQGRVTAYASVIDMQTNDPTYVPAQ